MKPSPTRISASSVARVITLVTARPADPNRPADPTRAVDPVGAVDRVGPAGSVDPVGPSEVGVVTPALQVLPVAEV